MIEGVHNHEGPFANLLQEFVLETLVLSQVLLKDFFELRLLHEGVFVGDRYRMLIWPKPIFVEVEKVCEEGSQGQLLSLLILRLRKEVRGDCVDVSLKVDIGHEGLVAF